MDRLKSATAGICGGALAYFITIQFIGGNIPFAILGIGILFLYINLLLNITTLSPRTIIERTTEYIEKAIPPLSPELLHPELLYKKKLGIIDKAEMEVSKITDKPYLQLTITTKPFKFQDRKVDKVFKVISLIPQAKWLYDNLLDATGFPPETSPEDLVPKLTGIPIKFELRTIEYEKVMRLRVTRLYKAKKTKEVAK